MTKDKSRRKQLLGLIVSIVFYVVAIGSNAWYMSYVLLNAEAHKTERYREELGSLSKLEYDK